MKIEKRKIWLGMALVLTIIASIWPVHRDSVLVEAERRQGKSEASFSPFPEQDVWKAGADLFPSQSWTQQPKAASDAKPVEPAFPFVFKGRYLEGADSFVYLSDGDHFFKAKTGERIGDYLIDAIDSGSVTFTYVPLGNRHVLKIGEVAP